MCHSLFHNQLHGAVCNANHVNAGSYFYAYLIFGNGVEEGDAVDADDGYLLAFGTADGDEALACNYRYACLDAGYAGGCAVARC